MKVRQRHPVEVKTITLKKLRQHKNENDTKSYDESILKLLEDAERVKKIESNQRTNQEKDRN